MFPLNVPDALPLLVNDPAPLSVPLYVQLFTLFIVNASACPAVFVNPNPVEPVNPPIVAAARLLNTNPPAN